MVFEIRSAIVADVFAVFDESYFTVESIVTYK